MLNVEIPGSDNITARYLVLDYNGTLAKDGTILKGVADKLNILSKVLSVYIITADTFGTVKSNLKNCNCECVIIAGEYQGKQKCEFIKNLNSSEVIAIGNGFNDALMLKESALGIALIQDEGASVKTVCNADIVCTDILVALDLLLNPKRIKATLRN
ncbi:MAG TPA: HAD hydrolase family protein [Bacteroidales bacterium]|nr:HAD hydrolase family protein [Bacteroidales bacterium]